MQYVSDSEIRRWLRDTVFRGNQLLSTLEEPRVHSNDNHSCDSEVVDFQNDTLRVDQVVIPLGPRPKTAQLVLSFWASSERFLTHDQILQKVYKTRSDASPRLYQADRSKMTKLISRSRSYLNHACNSSGLRYRIVWFDYDKEKGGWHLFRIFKDEILH